ncbi:MAG: hypothetical protein QXK37_00400 [Candidatus Woesearchaeota archaeon]
MTEVKIESAIAVLLFLLVATSFVSGSSVCVLTGFVTDISGAAAEEGTSVEIINLDLGTVSKTPTGTNWPYENMFVKAITCNFNDTIVVRTKYNNTLAAEKRIVYDHLPYEVNITFPVEVFKPKESQTLNDTSQKSKKTTEREISKDGGGGSGGSNGPINTKEDECMFGCLSDYVFPRMLNESVTNIVPIDSQVRLYLLGEDARVWMVIADIRKHSQDSIEINFSTLDGKLMLKKGVPSKLDLDNDSNDDIVIRLEDLDENDAYLRFDRIIGGMNSTPEISKPKVINPLEEEKKGNLLLIGILAVLVIVFLVQIYFEKRNDK